MAEVDLRVSEPSRADRMTALLEWWWGCLYFSIN
jgi:hypothetical protein